MGIYIFTTKKLIEYLEADEEDENSSNDFGKNIIPNFLNNGERLFSYKFDGYWKDVGTISSLWESNMDLIGENPTLNIQDNNFRIFSRNTARPPQVHGKNSTVKNSLISEGCKIYGTVINSVLSGGVTVEEGALIKDSVIMEDVCVKTGAKVYKSIVDSDVVICKNATVGREDAPKENITVIAKGTEIAPGATVVD
jgi:glucose-1-phosphate adenylyltransferase